MPGYPWKEFLQHLSRDIIESGEFDDLLPDEVIQSGWLGFDGATETEIAAAQARLGVVLPPSYRSFLSVSNGWRMVTSFVIKLWPTSEICWHRERHADGIEAWIEADPGDDISDDEYLVYGEDADQPFRSQYLRAALEVSEWCDGVFLLNPEIVTEDGEWEAWFHAPWILGARRYRSFWELMQGEHRGFLELMKQLRGEPTPRVDPKLGVPATDLEGLVAALNRTDDRDRELALGALANLRDRRAVEAVLAIYDCEDESTEIRCAGARTLGDLRDERAIDPLLHRLRGLAKVWIKEIEPKGLVRTGDDHQIIALRHATRQGLLNLGAVVIPHLLDAMKDSDPVFRAEVVDLLCYARRQEGVFEHLSAMLDDPDPTVRRTLVRSIDQLHDDRWFDLVYPRALEDPAPEVRIEAIRVLCRVTKSEDVVQRIEQLARDDVSQLVRDAALEALDK